MSENDSFQIGEPAIMNIAGQDLTINSASWNGGRDGAAWSNPVVPTEPSDIPVGTFSFGVLDANGVEVPEPFKVAYKSAFANNAKITYPSGKSVLVGDYSGEHLTVPGSRINELAKRVNEEQKRNFELYLGSLFDKNTESHEDYIQDGKWIKNFHGFRQDMIDMALQAGYNIEETVDGNSKLVPIEPEDATLEPLTETDCN